MSRGYSSRVPFETLKGLIISKIERQGPNYEPALHITTVDGREFVQEHHGECCEFVTIEEIHGDLNDLLNTPILLAEVVHSHKDPLNPDDIDDGCSTWAFYKLATIKGSVTIRWYGESNGYYSQTPDFYECTQSKE